MEESEREFAEALVAALGDNEAAYGTAAKLARQVIDCVAAAPADELLKVSMVQRLIVLLQEALEETELWQAYRTKKERLETAEQWLGQWVITEDQTVFNCGTKKADGHCDHFASGYCSMSDTFGAGGKVLGVSCDEYARVWLQLDWGYAVRVTDDTIVRRMTDEERKRSGNG